MAIVPDLSGNASPTLNGRGGVDRKLSDPNRYISGSPLGVTAPQYSGEIVQDNVGAQLWIGHAGLGVNDWTPIAKAI